MSVVPPVRNDAASKDDYPWWALIGPGLAAVLGLFLLTVVFFGTEPTTPIQRDLGYSTLTFLLSAVVAYLVGAAITFPLGLVLGARNPTAVVLPALGVMLAAVLLTAFAGGGVVILVARLLTGLGAGAAVGVTTKVLTRIRGQRGVAAAVTGAAGVLAAAAAPFVNELVSKALSFRIMFLVLAPVVVAVLLVNAVIGIVRYTTTRRPARPPQAYLPNTTRR